VSRPASPVAASVTLGTAVDVFGVSFGVLAAAVTATIRALS
jgi:hypothetical protein